MSDPRLTAVEKAVHESLRETVYTCSRVWEAWSVGTMSEEDFAPAWEDDDLINDIATEALKAADNASTITTVAELDALPIGSVILDGDPAVLQMVEKSKIVGSEWAMANEEYLYTSGKITLPARVIHWGQP